MKISAQFQNDFLFYFMVLSLAVTIFQSSRSMGPKCISLVWPLLKIYAPINSLSPAEIMPPAYFSFWFSRRPYDKISWDTLRCFSIDRLCSETQLEMSHEFQIFWLHAYITKSLSDAREFLWFFFLFICSVTSTLADVSTTFSFVNTF